MACSFIHDVNKTKEFGFVTRSSSSIFTFILYSEFICIYLTLFYLY